MQGDPVTHELSVLASPLAGRWRVLVDDVLRDAAASLRSHALPTQVQVHHARAGLKQAAALLGLVPDTCRSQAKSARRAVGHVQQALGCARDSQAIVEALDDLARRGKAGQSQFQHLRDRLVEAIHPDTTILKAQAAGLDRALASIPASVIDSSSGKDIIKRAQKAFREARALRPRKRAHASAKALHNFRRAAVLHRYQIAFLDAGGMAKRVRHLERLRKLLGRNHDLGLLKEALVELKPRAQACMLRPVLGIISDTQRRLRRKAIWLGRRLFRRKAGQELSRSLQAVSVGR